MPKSTLAIRIDGDLAKKVRLFCAEHGIKQGFFVEKALEAKLEEEELKEDLLDFKTLKVQEKSALSFEEYLKHRRR